MACNNCCSIFFSLSNAILFDDKFQQSQLDDKDRTIRIQQNLINKLEAEVDHTNSGSIRQQPEQTIDTANTATQTDRVSEK